MELLLGGFALLAIGLGGWWMVRSKSKSSVQEEAGSKPYTLIAHGLGGILSDTYTNSYEAFVYNYAKGHRMFEADLILSSDGYLVARHDWYAYLQPSLPPDKQNVPITLKEFKQYKIYNKYTPLDFHDIALLMRQYPDIYLVTDTKETDPDLISKQFNTIKSIVEQVDPTILQRIIPEIYNPEMYRIVMDIYPFKKCFYPIYLTNASDKEVVEFAVQKRIPVVAMPVERAGKPFLRMLDQNGISACVFTLNEVNEINKYRKMGVQGFYTDFVTNADLSGL